MKTSPILDHYSIQSVKGKKQILTGADFDNLVADAKDLYYRRVLMDEKQKGEA